MITKNNNLHPPNFNKLAQPPFARKTLLSTTMISNKNVTFSEATSTPQYSPAPLYDDVAQEVISVSSSPEPTEVDQASTEANINDDYDMLSYPLDTVSAFTCGPKEFVHLTRTPDSWTTLKAYIPNTNTRASLDQLRELETQMITLFGVITRLVTRGSPGMNITVIDLLEVRAFFWDEYKKVYRHMYSGEFHRSACNALNDLRHQARATNCLPRPAFQFVHYNPAYENGPWVGGNEVALCTRCRRDGHISKECGYDQAPGNARHQNRFHRDNHNYEVKNGVHAHRSPPPVASGSTRAARRQLRRHDTPRPFNTNHPATVHISRSININRDDWA